MQDMRYCSEPWVLKSCLPTGHPQGLGIDFGWSQLRFFACMGREGEAYRGSPTKISDTTCNRRKKPKVIGIGFC